ncbi:MAG: AarF/UbiB family protein [Thermodesulfobacteriota bacterium]|nr:AarF/UbiB family protein [Thermodesulfobacteriota bacterium]
MDILKISKRYKDFKRLKQILSTFLKYGFDDVVERIEAKRSLRVSKIVLKTMKRKELEGFTTPQRVRMAFEELGPTFIKFGQMLSVRPGLIPRDFTEELSKLQDAVAPFSYELSQSIIERDLSKPVDHLFSSFEKNPIAAASLAQVHQATTLNGEEVVVKIKRPDISSLIESDIRILLDLAKLIERYIPESELYNPTGLVHEFAKTIREELDFLREGRNIDRFRRHFAEDDTVYILKVFWELTTSNVLTMERIRGIKPSDIESIEKAGLDRKIIAENGAHLILEEVFEHRFFHADPHPGNIFILENNVIAPVDFGMVGYIDESIADQIGKLLIGIIRRDSDRVVGVLATLGMIDETFDQYGLRYDISNFIEHYHQVSFYKINMSHIIEELIDISWKYGIRLPLPIVMMSRALMLSEALGRLLYPEFNMIPFIVPYEKKILQKRFRRRGKEAVRFLEGMNLFIQRLPYDLSEILTKIKQGKLIVNLEHKGLERLTDERNRAINHISFSFIIAALIIGSSFIIRYQMKPIIFGYSLVGLLGFFFAGVLGIWVIISALRSGRL